MGEGGVGDAGEGVWGGMRGIGHQNVEVLEGEERYEVMTKMFYTYVQPIFRVSSRSDEDPDILRDEEYSCICISATSFCISMIERPVGFNDPSSSSIEVLHACCWWSVHDKTQSPWSPGINR